MATIRAAPGTGQNTDLSDEDLAALQADLGRLNKVASGLGDRAVRYVAGGTDTSALMEIKPSGRRQRRPPFWETTNPTKPTRSTRPCAARAHPYAGVAAGRAAPFAVLLDIMLGTVDQVAHAPGCLLHKTRVPTTANPHWSTPPHLRTRPSVRCSWLALSFCGFVCRSAPLQRCPPGSASTLPMSNESTVARTRLTQGPRVEFC